MIYKHRLDSMYVIADFPYHEQIKHTLLKLIDESNARSMFNETDKLNITKADWEDSLDLSRPWTHYLLNYLNPHIAEVFKEMGFNKFLLKDIWFQQYLNKASHGVPYGYIKLEDVPKNTSSIKLNKVFIPAAAWGVAKEEDDPVLGQPFVGEANSACSQTYLVIGYDPINHNFSKEQCENIASYISTKFFRYLVSLKKRTQNGPRHVYQFVPIQDFSKPWTDEKLYKKYKLTADEIAFIEKMIRPMVLRHE